jgi:uncharacterized protein YbjT (DUF2867 family)
LVRAGGAVGEALARRLIEQGDEVRVIDASPDHVAGWEALGVHVARGSESDADLVERAAQNVRTIVVIEDELGRADDVIEELVTAAARANVSRIVVWGAGPSDAIREHLQRSGMEFVLLSSGKKGLLRKGPDPTAVAEAIDAADDIAGEPHLVVDLNDAGGRAALGL